MVGKVASYDGSCNKSSGTSSVAQISAIERTQLWREKVKESGYQERLKDSEVCIQVRTYYLVI